jgi:hypothetical protein
MDQNYGLFVFEQHDTFTEPDAQATVWRYMDFTKFMACLDTQSLWFSKPEFLGDPWELAYSRANLQQFRARHTSNGDGNFDETTLKNYRATLDSMYVNCWHCGEVESAAMWKLYLTSFEGVALQSNWSHLTASIGKTRDPVLGGHVRYIDFEKDETSSTNLFYPTTTKRESFKYEQEVRLVNWWRPDRSTGIPDYEQVPSQRGIEIPFNIYQALHRVVICPGSSDWFKDLVHRVASRYFDSIPIENSSMDDEPTRL